MRTIITITNNDEVNNNMKHVVNISKELQEDYGTTEEVTEIKLNKKPNSEPFRITPEGKSVYVKLDYDRARKGYYCENLETGNERFFKANKTVYIGFIY
tara:strand:- start:170 stop:466 length:297 start_codon:yes stop_codon:yes gene_type:complete